MKIHPVTACFPMMRDAEMVELVADIKERGLLYPVTMMGDVLLDGRNRIEACKQADVKLRTEKYSGNDPVGFIISTNKRRNLDESQRSMVAALISNVRIGRNWGPYSANWPNKISAQQAASVMNVSVRSVTRAKAVLSVSPKLAEKVVQGTIKVARAERQVKEKKEAAALEVAVAEVDAEKKLDISKVCDIRHCSMDALLASGIKPDIVISDPPYPKEYLRLYGELAEACNKAGISNVAVMCGQSYLPEILALMCKHLQYRWTIAYLTPGGQAVQVWPKKVNTFWKPVLVFGNAREWIGDVANSKVNDNDKRFHDWGQSESGMADLVDRLTKPGQLVCDPFVGAGTTAVVCLRLGRRFIGCDIDKDAVEKSMMRCIKEGTNG